MDTSQLRLLSGSLVFSFLNEDNISTYLQVALVVKNASAGAIRGVGSMLGQEDPLEEGMASHTVFLPGESPWTQEPGGPQSIGSRRVGYD